jgi:ABC-type amino acid transport system permease subunit
MTSMELAAIILGLAALGGATMAVMRLRGTPRPPDWMAMGHGAAAAVGVSFLIYAAFTTGIPAMAQLALGLFVLAALGGLFINLKFHRSQQALPIPLMLGHAATAVTAYVLLLLAVLG